MKFITWFIILVHGKVILNGSLDEIKENYAKKNIIIKADDLDIDAIKKIKVKNQKKLNHYRMEEHVNGYFVVMDEEETRQIAVAQALSSGRAGVFYEKKALITTLQKHPIDTKNVYIVEVNVPRSSIANANCIKFGIKSGGHPITKIESYDDAIKSVS